MGTKRFAVALVIVCLGLVLGMGTLASADSLQVNLVWEKSFGLPVWDFAVGQRAGGGSYVKVVVTESDLGDSVNISFFDQEMRLTRRLELPALSQAHLSKNGQWVGTLTPMAVSEECHRNTRLSVYDSYGTELWSVDSVWMPTEIRILGNAERVAFFYASGEGDGIQFVEPTGYISPLFDPITGDSLSADSIWGADLVLFPSVSGDGELLAINACTYPRESSTVFVFAKDGSELWRKQLPEQAAAETEVSASGLVVASAFTGGVSHNAYLLDVPGAFLQIHPLEGWAPVGLFHDGAILAGAFGSHFIAAYATATVDTLWHFHDPNSTASFTSLDVSDAVPFSVLAAATTDDTTRALTPNTQLPRYVYLIGPQAELLWKQEYSGQGYPSFNGPVVKFGRPSAQVFYVGNRNKLYCYVRR